MTKNYPYTYTVQVIFRDLDPLNHVNNAVYFTYFESARIKYFAEILGQTWQEQFPIVLAKARCDFKSPALRDEYLYIGLGVTRFGWSSFDIVYRVEAQSGRLVAIAKTVSVHFNPATGKSQVIPEEVKASVLAYQGDWQLEE